MTFKDISDLLFSNYLISDLSLNKICFCLTTSFLISLWIFFVYEKYTKNEFYSKNFNISLALMPIITTGIILAMQSNLVISLGMVGALSIVRYRTAIKSSLDLFFMFWAISIGIICGAGQYFLAIIMSLIVSFLLLFLSKLDFTRKLNVLIVRCAKTEDIILLKKDLKPISSYLKVKSEQVNTDYVEVILDCKIKKGKDLVVFLSNKEYIKNFQVLSNG